MNVVLIGMKHCGKSTVGRGLADRWGCPFHDVDPMIEATAACETGEGLSVRDLLDRHGEERFHQVEGMVICELYLKLNRPDSTAVVALGGRTALNPKIGDLLNGIGLKIFIETAFEELWARVQRSGVPPFLDPQDPKRDFLATCRQRQQAYERQADLRLNLGGLDPASAVDLVAHRIEEHTRGG